MPQSAMPKPSGRGGRRYLPYAFTEQGVAMLSAVLHSLSLLEFHEPPIKMQPARNLLSDLRTDCWNFLMNGVESVPLVGNVHQVLVSAIAHRIEHMSQEDLQALVAQADLALRNEVAALQERVRQLEEALMQQRADSDRMRADYERALYKLTRDFVTEKDWDDFDPKEYTVSAAELRAVIDNVGASRLV